MKEIELMSAINLMTRETECQLKKKLKKTKVDFRDAGQRMGDAFGPSCDWHDNAAADFAVEEYRVIGARKAELQSVLRDVKIIESRQKIDDVGLGNTVVIKMGDSDINEKFTLLGPYDVIVDHDEMRARVSHQSFVGKALMGMKKGETKTFGLGKGRVQIITVKKILRGEFLQ